NRANSMSTLQNVRYSTTLAPSMSVRINIIQTAHPPTSSRDLRTRVKATTPRLAGPPVATSGCCEAAQSHGSPNSRSSRRSQRPSQSTSPHREPALHNQV
ncbi:hypothetical protein SPRG_16603, partial [Saprolegnia parasitica CBS 223.65]